MKQQLSGLLIMSTLLLNGCSTGLQTGTPTPDPLAASAESVVSVTGVVLPSQWAGLSVEIPGVVEEVLAVDGSQVIEGAVLVRLKGMDQAEAAVSAARLEQADAERALKMLNDNSAGQLAQAQASMASARQAWVKAERDLDKYEETAYLDDVKTAERDVKREGDQLDEAKKKFAKFEDLPETNDDREYYLERLQDQQRDYDEAVRDLTDLQMEKAAVEAASAQAKADYDLAVKQAEERSNGPSASDLAVASARVDGARAQVAAAIANRDRLELKAPFTGILSGLKARAGEYVVPGQVLLSLAGSGPLQVETTDMNEIDVTRVNMGDQADLTFDALPGKVIHGKIIQIANKSSEGAGVNYTVKIELAEVPPELLWGMTAFVDVKVNK
jgi:multidrug resistance efflux pump